MKQTIQVKLAAEPEQHAALLSTLEWFNAACNWLADLAFRNACANKYALQKLAYRQVRERFGLSAQMTIRAIAKVCEAYKRDKQIKPRFRERGAMTFDERIMSFKRQAKGQENGQAKRQELVSLLTLGGRVVVPIHFGEVQAARLPLARGQADLLYRDGAFYLSLLVEVPEPAPADPSEYIGVDLGLVRIATTSDGDSFAGNQLNSIRARYSRLRAKLQSKGTRSAKRLLKKRRRRESRFQRDVNHQISKALVTRAQDTNRGIALEDLKGIRARVTVRRGQRRVIHSWAFGQLRAFVEYKSRASGVKVVAVDPRNTSRTCPNCGCIDKANRPNQATFRCVACGHTANADENAARIIAFRAGLSVMQPGAAVGESVAS